MPLFALLLILIAAGAHSGWNFLAKQKAHSKDLIWFSSAGASILFLPIVIHTGFSFRDATVPVICLLATGALHFLYTECLLRGYRSGDLSVVYPLARGTGPLLSSWGAILVLRESFSLLAAGGALLVAAGIVTICGGFQALLRPHARAGLIWGSLTGVVIASYTLVDGYAARTLLVSPFLIDYAGNAFRAVVLASRANGRWRSLRAEFNQCWKEALGISVLMPLGYILILFAMRVAPISHVAPAREMSMMIGAWMGARLLREGQVKRRVLGSSLIAAGVAALAIS